MRNGFSLVELLVVIGILSLLAAILLPAIQRVREAANRMACGSNLRQLALAAHHFHADFARLPPGYLGPAIANNTNYPAHFYEGQWIGHFPLLLPYLEEDTLFRQLEVNFDVRTVTTLPWFWSAPQVPHAKNRTAGMAKLRIFRCPSAANFLPEIGVQGSGGGGTLLGVHVFNSLQQGVMTDGWKDDYVISAAFRFQARTNYMGVAACGSGDHPFFSLYEGIYTNRSRNSLGQITARDGTANTLLYGETCGSRWDGSQPDTYDICWMGGGGLGTYLGLQRGRAAVTVAFSSYHASGVQFAFADGSVRTVRYGETEWDGTAQSQDWSLLQQLAGWRDGGTADTSDLLD